MPLLQQILFERALTEQSIQVDALTIDLENAICYNNGIKYNVLYPKKYVEEVEKLDHTKIYNYNFRGNHFPRREWVKLFTDDKDTKSVVEFTLKGKQIEEDNKYEFDTKYYQDLCSTKFTLCPGGDFDWSYRFFEACMCKSIPIIECMHVKHITMDGFKFYCKDDIFIDGVMVNPPEYRQDWIDHNFALFMEKHTIN